jgi:predicted NBD/HSP70 family sugar kinase
MKAGIESRKFAGFASSSKLSIIEALIEFGPMSRSDLADLIGLSRSALTELSRDLIAMDIMHETSVSYNKQRRGRPSVLLALNAEHGYFVGVCITDHQSPLLALCDLHGNPLNQIAIAVTDDPKVIAQNIKNGISNLLVGKHILLKKVLGIGLAMSGFVDRERGVCLHSISLGWSDVRIAEMVHCATGIPTYIDNDANTVATGEKLFGHAREAKNFSIITLSNTVGCAHYIGGRLYRGENGGAGEIGHCLSDPDGVLCRCGRVGCLDTIAGFDAMLRSAKKHQLAVASFHDLEQLAANGNPQAVTILRRAGHALGLAVANLIQINNPEMVLFACTEAFHNGLFVASIRQTIENNILSRFLPSTSLLFYSVEKDFWARGAASIAAHEFLIAQASLKS